MKKMLAGCLLFFALFFVAAAATAQDAEEDWHGGADWHDSIEKWQNVEISKKEKGVKTEVVGKVMLKNMKLLFAPIFIHDMAWEDWTLSGKTGDLRSKLEKDVPMFVSLKGMRTLTKYRLPAPDVSHPMGAEERCYTFRIEEVLWMKTKEELAAIEKQIEEMHAKYKSLLDGKKLDEAIEIYEEAKKIAASIQLWGDDSEGGETFDPWGGENYKKIRELDKTTRGEGDIADKIIAFATLVEGSYNKEHYQKGFADFVGKEADAIKKDKKKICGKLEKDLHSVHYKNIGAALFTAKQYYLFYEFSRLLIVPGASHNVGDTFKRMNATNDFFASFPEEELVQVPATIERFFRTYIKTMRNNKGSINWESNWKGRMREGKEYAVPLLNRLKKDFPNAKWKPPIEKVLEYIESLNWDSPVE